MQTTDVQELPFVELPKDENGHPEEDDDEQNSERGARRTEAAVEVRAAEDCIVRNADF